MGVRWGPSGGLGGNNFSHEIVGHERIASLIVRAGDWIDGIQIVTLSAGTHVSFYPHQGGYGGAFHFVSVGPRERFLEISGTYDNYVRFLRIRTDQFERTFGRFDSNHYPFKYQIPDGFELSGIFGSSGRYLDSIGMICRTAPIILG